VEHGTTLLLGLEGFAVQRVELSGDETRVVHLTAAEPTAAACPGCGVPSTSRKQNATTRPKDLPYGEAPLRLRWHKTRWRCREVLCARGSFTESLPEVGPRARRTGRLDRAAARGVEDGRCVAEVAASLGVSWPTAQRAVDAHAAAVLGEPEPTTMLGIDETRRGRPGWAQIPLGEPDAGKWRRVDPWETGFVDLEGAQGLLGQVRGRSSKDVVAWLAQRSPQWRAGVRVVAIDPAAPYAHAVRVALPDARIAVDHFHLVALANQAVTRTRQRVLREGLGRRGRKTDPLWANRRRLLRGRERLRLGQFDRLWGDLGAHDTAGELTAAWIAKEELRALLACAARGGVRSDIAHRLARFYDWCARVDVPEVTTLASTVETWWPEILVFLTTGITNARTEGTNRQIKQVKRAAAGFRNEKHYRARVRLHCTRRHRRMSASQALPAQS
jgi:transposase